MADLVSFCSTRIHPYPSLLEAGPLFLFQDVSKRQGRLFFSDIITLEKESVLILLQLISVHISHVSFKFVFSNRLFESASTHCSWFACLF